MKEEGTKEEGRQRVEVKQMPTMSEMLVLILIPEALFLKRLSIM